MIEYLGNDMFRISFLDGNEKIFSREEIFFIKNLAEKIETAEKKKQENSLFK